MFPTEVGPKLIGRVHDAPASNVPTDGAVLTMSGQAVPPELFNVKFGEMLGLFPLDGILNVSVMFPLFDSVAVFGLSLLVEPTGVDAKFRVGASTKSSFTMRLFRLSATKTLPLGSTTT